MRAYRSQYDNIMSQIEDDFVVRDDEVVQAFRSIYEDDEDDAEDGNAEIAQEGAPVQNGITFGECMHIFTGNSVA